MRTTTLILSLLAFALLVACGGAPPVPPTCGVEGLPCCVDDGGATCEAGLTCGGGTPGTCSRAGVRNDGLRPLDAQSSDVAPPACARVCARDADCCAGQVCHPLYKGCVPPCGVFGMPCCTSGALCADGLTCLTTVPGGPTCAPQP